MNLKTIKNKNYAGTYEIWTLGEPNCPIPITDRVNVQVGDWVVDLNNTVVKVLGIKTFQTDIQRQIRVVTCFGIDVYVTVNKKTEHQTYQKLDFNRSRQQFCSIQKKWEDLTRLSSKSQRFLTLSLQTGSYVEAYKIMSGVKEVSVAKRLTLTNKFRGTLRSPAGRKFLGMALADVAKSRGLDQEYFIDLLKTSVGDEINTELKLDLTKILASSTGDEEISSMFNTNTQTSITLLPAPKQKQIEETSFKEVPTEQLKT